MRNVEGHGFSHAAKPQIRSRKVDGGTTNTYVYNSRGMRAGLAGGENLFDLNGNIVSVVTPGTATLAYNRYTVGGRLLAANLSGTTDFYHQDWLGGIRAGSSLSGSLIDSCTNRPFGDGTNYCGLWYFAGLMSDPWDTLNTSATRSQSPASGRWLTPDPAGMAAMDLSNPQTWNRYAYVLNNPVSFTDPSGLIDPSGMCWFCGGGGGSVPGYYGGDGFGCFMDSLACGTFPTTVLGGNSYGRLPQGISPITEVPGGFAFPTIDANGGISYSYSSDVYNGDLGLPGSAANNGPSARTAGCIARGLQSTFGGGATSGASAGETGGHWNFNVQLQFSSFDAVSAFTSTYAASAASGWPPPARFGSGPALHLENLGSWSVADGSYSIDGTAHIDLFNPNTGFGGIAGHVGVDFLWGHVVQFFGGSIDPSRCPY
jgi:RHS repeat-associated protein